MQKSSHQIEGLTIAIIHMEAMLDFYTNVFNLQFEEKAMYGTKLYNTNWNGLNLLFCPAEIAGNTATQNRHQFDIVVPNLQEVIDEALTYGGEKMGPLAENESFLSIGMYDPDKNSIVFKQYKNIL